MVKTTNQLIHCRCIIATLYSSALQVLKIHRVVLGKLSWQSLRSGMKRTKRRCFLARTYGKKPMGGDVQKFDFMRVADLKFHLEVS